jgi:hypothetical protein
LTSATTPGTSTAKPPVGAREGLQRIDEDLAGAEKSVQALIDLVVHDGRADDRVLSILERKKALLGHLRDFFGTVPEKLGGAS